MEPKTERPKPTKEELILRTRIAFILWHTDNRDNVTNDTEERKAAFDLVRKDYQRKALDLTQRLENNNLMIVDTDPKA